MRIVAKIKEEMLARRFSTFLQSEKIANSLEVALDAADSPSTWIIWVHNEDELGSALTFYELFVKNPDDAFFARVPPGKTGDLVGIETDQQGEVSQEARSQMVRFRSPLTRLLLWASLFVFALNAYQRWQTKGHEILSPIAFTLIYDLPERLVKLNSFFLTHNLSPMHEEKLTEAQKRELEAINQIPMWQGFSAFLVPQDKEEGVRERVPSFTKIREGEVWRLFTPAILHLNLFHIGLNLLGLLVLGPRIERKLTAIRYLLLTLTLALFSNLCQYLMGGPLFLGLSGILSGYVGFVWSRRRVAPWEGYDLPSSLFVFFYCYLLFIFVAQVISYFLQLFSGQGVVIPIANTAHISAACLGALLGRLSLFARRPLER